MTTHVMVLHGQLSSAVKLKQVLERAGAFDVHPFTTLAAAAEYLREHVQDVALLHLPSLSAAPDEVMNALRAAQADIMVIVVPAQNEATTQALGIQASVDSNIKPRDLAAVIENLFQRRQRPTSGAQSPSKHVTRILDQPPPTLPENNRIDEVLAGFSYGETPVEFEDDESARASAEASFDEMIGALPFIMDSDDEEQSDEFSRLVNSMRESRTHRSLPQRQRGLIDFVIRDDANRDAGERSNFDRLAAQEPPLPSLDEEGTLSELFAKAQDKSFRRVLSILADEPTEDTGASEPVEPDADDSEPLPMWDMNMLKPASRPPSQAPNPSADDYDFDADAPASPAQMILQQTNARGGTTGGFALEELIASIERKLPAHRPQVQPLPSWIQADKLDAALFEAALDPTMGGDEPEDLPEGWMADQTTLPNRAQRIAGDTEVFNQDTEWLDLPAKMRDGTAPIPQTPPDTLPEAIPDLDLLPGVRRITEPPYMLPETGGWGDDFVTSDFDTQFQMMAAFEVARLDYTSDQAPAEPVESVAGLYSEAAPSEPYIMQLATSLTEIALETTAEAILLVRAGEIVGYAGAMPREEAEELRDLIGDDWNAPPAQARIRFVTAPSSGHDFMVYSRATVEDLTLSLVFAGSTPLRDIRRQGRRLEAALIDAPEASAEPVAAISTPPASTLGSSTPALPDVIEDEAIQRTPLAFVWLLNDPTARLEPAVAQAITSGLRVQLIELLWDIRELHVDEDFVYLLAHVPGEEPPFHLVRDLKRRAGEIARAQNAALAPDTLWSDSYLVVTPGRPLDIEEIQQFISFERM